jgi:hypothetical protein
MKKVNVVCIVTNDDAGEAEARGFRDVAGDCIRAFFRTIETAQLQDAQYWIRSAPDAAWPGQRDDDMQRIVAVAIIGSDSNPPKLLRSIQADLHEWLPGKSARWQFMPVKVRADAPEPNNLGVFHFDYPDFLIPYPSADADSLCLAAPEFVFVGGVPMRPPRDTQQETFTSALKHGWSDKPRPSWIRFALPNRITRQQPPLIGHRVRFEVAGTAETLHDVVTALQGILEKQNRDYGAGFKIVRDPSGSEAATAGDVTTIVVTSDRWRPEGDLERVILLCDEPQETKRYGLYFFEQKDDKPKSVRRKYRNMVVAPAAQWTRWAEYIFLSWLPTRARMP